MSLIGKPTVKSTTAFDVNKSDDNPYIINFTWNGQRCNGNRLTIIETGKSNDILGLSSTYHKLTSSECKTLGLVNGKTYHATITMLDFKGDAASNPSDQFLLYCYSTPVFNIMNLTNNSTIKHTDFIAMLQFSSKSMDLSSYRFYLYDSSKILLDSSDELYVLPNSDTTDYSDCSYTFHGLENGKSYYIEAIGVTVYGMQLKCSYCITVQTDSSSIYNTVSANSTRDGNASLDITCIPMGYESNDVSYIGDEEINLTNPDSYVKYTLIKPLDDFKFMGELRGIKNLNKPVISFSNTSTGDSEISLVPTVNYIHSSYQYRLETKEIVMLHDTEEIYTNGAKTFVLLDDGGMSIKTYSLYVKQYNESGEQIGYTKKVTVNQELDISSANYIKLFGSGAGDDVVFVTYRMNTLTNVNDLIRPTPFVYQNSNWVDYIVSAQMIFKLYVDNKQYTVGGSSFPLDYDKENDIFYLDENKKYLIEISRVNGNYKLAVTEGRKGR